MEWEDPPQGICAEGPQDSAPENARPPPHRGILIYHGLAVAVAGTRVCGARSRLTRLATQGVSRRGPRGERDKIESGGHSMHQRFDRAGTWEVQAHTVLVRFDLCCHVAESQAQRRGWGVGQRGMLEGVWAQSVLQAIGRTGQAEPQTVGEERRRGRTVAGEVVLDRLDRVVAIAAGAGEVLGQPRRGRGRQRRAHTPWGIPRRPHFGFEEDPPGLGPGGRGIEQLGIQTAAGGRTGAMGLRAGGALLVQPARFLPARCGVPPSPRLAGEAAAQIGPAIGGAPLAARGGRPLTIATDQEGRLRPMPTQIRQQPDQPHGIFGSRRAGARA